MYSLKHILEVRAGKNVPVKYISFTGNTSQISDLIPTVSSVFCFCFYLLPSLALNVLHTQSTEATQEVYKHKRAGEEGRVITQWYTSAKGCRRRRKKAFYYMDLSVAADMRQFITIA